MATWGTELQKVGNFVTTQFGNAGRTINDFFNGTVKRTVGEVGTYFINGGTTVVGINVNSIESMKGAIREYCKDVETALGELENYDPEVAFKGDAIVPALKAYIEAVKETCGAIVSNMLAFNDQLTEVQKAYETKDQNAGSTIKSSSESVRSAYTRYTEGGSSVQ